MIFTEQKEYQQLLMQKSVYHKQISKSYHPLCFNVNNVNDFVKSTNHLKVACIISTNLSKKNQTKLSEEQKLFIVIGIPFCDKSENKSY